MTDLQTSVLYVLLMEPKQSPIIFRELSEEYFTNEFKTVFKACKELYNQRKDIDQVTILDKLGNSYINTIVSITESPAYSSNIKTYIEALKDNYARKNAIRKTESLLFELNNKEISIAEFQNKYLEISKLFNSNNSKFESSVMKDGLRNLYNELSTSKKTYYKTGFKKLDKYLLIDKGEYIIIGGRPSSGKTTLSTNIMVSMSEKYKVLFFSLETPKEMIFKKIVSAGALVQMNKLLNNDLKDEDYQSIIDCSNKYCNYNLEVIEAAGMTVNDMAAKAIQEKADIVFIDYIGLIKSNGKDNYEKTTNISRDLHTFAQKEKITVIALSQLRRPNNAKKGEEPTMSDLRESGQLEQDADAILLIHNPEEDNEDSDISKQKRNLIIAKNKKGELLRIIYDFYGSTQLFKEN